MANNQIRMEIGSGAHYLVGRGRERVIIAGDFHALDNFLKTPTDIICKIRAWQKRFIEILGDAFFILVFSYPCYNQRPWTWYDELLRSKKSCLHPYCHYPFYRVTKNISERWIS